METLEGKSSIQDYQSMVLFFWKYPTLSWFRRDILDVRQTFGAKKKGILKMDENNTNINTWHSLGSSMT